MPDATGEAKQAPLSVTFDRRLKLEFHGAKITSDGGLLAYRELDDVLGLTDLAVSALTEGRRGKNIRHRLLGLLRQAVYGRLAGYEDGLRRGIQSFTLPAPAPPAGRTSDERPFEEHRCHRQQQSSGESRFRRWADGPSPMRQVAGAMDLTARTWVLVLLALLASGSKAGAEPVDIELVLAVDVSISVDGSELDLQRQGLAAAFRDPAVAAAIAANAQGVAVSVVLWAGAEQQETVVDWALLTDAATSARFADAIDTALAVDPDLAGKTAIGDALYFALKSLDANGWDGVRRKIDVSGDGHANEGFKPEPVRDFAVLSSVTINGLAIVNDEPYLEQYYRDYVIGGPGAFVIVAADYQDFVEAIRRKLLQELLPAPTAHRVPAVTAPAAISS